MNGGQGWLLALAGQIEDRFADFFFRDYLSHNSSMILRYYRNIGRMLVHFSNYLWGWHGRRRSLADMKGFLRRGGCLPNVLTMIQELEGSAALALAIPQIGLYAPDKLPFGGDAARPCA